MLHDPADETHRKPRRLRNTPLRKYIGLASLVITLCYAGTMCFTLTRVVTNPKYIEEYKASQLSEEEQDMLQDYATVPMFLRGTFEKLIDRQQAKSNAEAEVKDAQSNE